jgi:N-acetylmuramoyl-L-alanine amidase
VVLDVHRREGVAEAPEPPALERPDPPEGIRVIVIDPGHGGSESGAVGASGAAEKDLTLALARTLKARLEAELAVRVTLTRDEDASLPHETRTAIANQNKADLFISLHLNSAFGPTAHGAETYFLSAAASDERAARSAAAENRPAAGAAPAGDDPLYDLQLMLWDLAQNHFLTQSQRLATLIQGELNATLGLRDRGVKQAPFLVLMGAAMPAVLVEVGFLSNPGEERQLQDPAYRAELAAALVRAISRYRDEVEPRPPAEEAAGAPAAAGEAAPREGAE